MIAYITLFYFLWRTSYLAFNILSIYLTFHLSYFLHHYFLFFDGLTLSTDDLSQVLFCVNGQEFLFFRSFDGFNDILNFVWYNKILNEFSFFLYYCEGFILLGKQMSVPFPVQTFYEQIWYHVLFRSTNDRKINRVGDIQNIYSVFKNLLEINLLYYNGFYLRRFLFRMTLFYEL